MSGDAPIRARIQSPGGAALTVRLLREGDGPALQAFNEALGQWTREHFLPHAYDEVTVAKVIQRALDGTDRTYVVLNGDEVVGYLFLWDMPQPVPVLGIGLSDAYQSMGLGEPLMQILIGDALEAERDGIELTTVLDNERAFALFSRMGFQYIRNVENMAGDGRIVLEREMFLALKPGAAVRREGYGPPV